MDSIFIPLMLSSRFGGVRYLLSSLSTLKLKVNTEPLSSSDSSEMLPL